MLLNRGMCRGGVLEDVRNDAHRRRRRIDVRIAHHELFEDVVLDGARELFRIDALLFRRNDVERENGQHGSVHRHRNAHLVERDAVEKDAHVLDGVDGDTGHADIARNAWVVGVVSAVGGQVEGDRQSLLPSGEVPAIECVALLGSREARVLPNGPRPTHVHRGIRAAQERRQPRHRLEVRHRVEIFGRVYGLDLDAFGGLPGLVGSRTDERVPVRERGGAALGGSIEVDRAEVGQAAHQ